MQLAIPYDNLGSVQQELFEYQRAETSHLAALHLTLYLAGFPGIDAAGIAGLTANDLCDLNRSALSHMATAYRGLAAAQKHLKEHQKAAAANAAAAHLEEFLAKCSEGREVWPLQ